MRKLNSCPAVVILFFILTGFAVDASAQELSRELKSNIINKISSLLEENDLERALA